MGRVLRLMECLHAIQHLLLRILCGMVSSQFNIKMYRLLLETLYFSSDTQFKYQKNYTTDRTLFALLTPCVMVSRVYLGYHTDSQVMGGCIVGIICAVVLFIFVKNNVNAQMKGERSWFLEVCEFYNFRNNFVNKYYLQ